MATNNLFLGEATPPKGKGQHFNHYTGRLKKNPVKKSTTHRKTCVSASKKLVKRGNLDFGASYGTF